MSDLLQQPVFRLKACPVPLEGRPCCAAALASCPAAVGRRQWTRRCSERRHHALTVAPLVVAEGECCLEQSLEDLCPLQLRTHRLLPPHPACRQVACATRAQLPPGAPHSERKLLLRQPEGRGARQPASKVRRLKGRGRGGAAVARRMPKAQCTGACGLDSNDHQAHGLPPAATAAAAPPTPAAAWPCRAPAAWGG